MMLNILGPLNKLGPLELVKSVKALLEKNTNIAIYDVPPINESAPLAFIELSSITPVQNKTMYRDKYIVFVHVIAKPSDSNVEMYKMIQEIEEAFSENILLNERFKLIKQVSEGLITIKKDPSGEKHAILSYSFDICYGFKLKI